MIDVDVSIEARGVVVSSFGKYDTLAGPPSGALGGGYGTAFGVRLGRAFTPFVGFEQGYLACSGCTSKSTFDDMFFGLRYETPSLDAIRFHAALDLGYRSVRASNPLFGTAGQVVYGPSALASNWRWSGFEPRVAFGPTFRVGPSAALDVSLTGAIGTFTRVEWSGVVSNPSHPTADSARSIPADVRATHAFAGLTLTARALLPISRTEP